MMMLRYPLLLLVFLLATGCVHRGSLTPPQNVQEHQRQLQAIADWQLTGKLGIRTADDSGSASLKWAQQLANYQINLSGPLGQKRMIITGTPDKVRLEQTGEPVQEAKTAEALIKKSVGWTLPVTQLAYWYAACPHPNCASLTCSKMKMACSTSCTKATGSSATAIIATRDLTARPCPCRAKSPPNIKTCAWYW